jgi:hypothetical protein
LKTALLKIAAVLLPAAFYIAAFELKALWLAGIGLLAELAVLIFLSRRKP